MRPGQTCGACRGCNNVADSLSIAPALGEASAPLLIMTPALAALTFPTTIYDRVGDIVRMPFRATYLERINVRGRDRIFVQVLLRCDYPQMLRINTSAIATDMVHDHAIRNVPIIE